MKTTVTKLIAMVSLSAVALAAGSAVACPKGGYGGYSSYSSYSSYVRPVYVEPIYTCYRPLHCFVFVLPGDTWATISQREFGSPKFFSSIASFNGIGLGTQLVVGQQIRLPEIHPNGALLPSNAPGMAPLALAAQGIPQGLGFAGPTNVGPQNVGPQNLAPQNFGTAGIGSPNMLQGPPQGTQLPQNMQPQNFNGAPTNGAPINGAPINSGSPIVSQNFANGPLANASAPMMNGSAPVGSMLLNNSAPQMNASAPFAGGSAAAAPTMNASAPIAGSVPSANIRLVSAESSVPSVAIGSELVLDGPALGETSGIVRLRLSGVAVKAEVLEWTASSVKIRLPELDLTAAMRAELEVLRADGSLASKSALQLTPAATKLAQGN